MKPIDDSFSDWEGSAFGFGYGAGEQYIIPLLKAFLSEVPLVDSYDHENLESVLGAPIAWLLINVLVREDILEYGTSPRFGWLTKAAKEEKTSS